MNLIRLLLLEREGEDPKPDLSAYSEEQQVYHTALLIEAGFVHGHALNDQNGQVTGTITTTLTWGGHEFLDAARNETVWKKAGERIRTTGVHVTSALLQELLKMLLKQQLGLP